MSTEQEFVNELLYDIEIDDGDSNVRWVYLNGVLIRRLGIKLSFLKHSSDYVDLYYSGNSTGMVTHLSDEHMFFSFPYISEMTFYSRMLYQVSEKQFKEIYYQ